MIDAASTIPFSGEERAVSLQVGRQAGEENLVKSRVSLAATHLPRGSLRRNRRLCEDLLLVQGEMHDAHYHLQQKLDNSYDTICGLEKRFINQRVELERDARRHTARIAILCAEHTVVSATLREDINETHENLSKAQRDCGSPEIVDENIRTTDNHDSSYSHLQISFQPSTADTPNRKLEALRYGFPNGDAVERIEAARSMHELEVQCVTAVNKLEASRHIWSRGRIRNKELLRFQLQQTTENNVAAMTARIFGRSRIRLRCSNRAISSKDDCSDDSISLTDGGCRMDVNDGVNGGSTCIAACKIGKISQQANQDDGTEKQTLKIEDRVLQAHGKTMDKLTVAGKTSTILAAERSRVEETLTRLRRELAIARSAYCRARTLAVMDTDSIRKLTEHDYIKKVETCSRRDILQVDVQTAVDASNTNTESNDYYARLSHAAVLRSGLGVSRHRAQGSASEVICEAHKTEYLDVRPEGYGCIASEAANGIVRILVAAITEARIGAGKASQDGDDGFQSPVDRGRKSSRDEHRNENTRWSSRTGIRDVDDRLDLLRHLVKCAHVYRANVQQLEDATKAMHSSKSGSERQKVSATQCLTVARGSSSLQFECDRSTCDYASSNCACRRRRQGIATGTKGSWVVRMLSSASLVAATCLAIDVDVAKESNDAVSFGCTNIRNNKKLPTLLRGQNRHISFGRNSDIHQDEASVVSDISAITVFSSRQNFNKAMRRR